MNDFDACVIGSGAGGGAVAWRLAMAGKRVLVLEKGPWLTEPDFVKDELNFVVRNVCAPDLRREQHVIEQRVDGAWKATPTRQSGNSFWNGSLVGGSSNFMSGFFHRMKPCDFRLLSEFGPIAGANLVDWPIGYDDLEPYYSLAEAVVGVSGRIVPHRFQEPRSTADFPYPPTAESPVASWVDQACETLGCVSVPLPRAILPWARGRRNGCQYSGCCGAYGCATGAKGSSRVALLDEAVASGNCHIRPLSQVFRLASNRAGAVTTAEFVDQAGRCHRVSAAVFVVACQAIESARLLLSSPGPRHPRGLGNRQGQVGRNLIFSAGGSVIGRLDCTRMDAERAAQARVVGPFVNRCLHDWYEFSAPDGRRTKGGLIDVLLAPTASIAGAQARRRDLQGNLVWGSAFKRRLERDLRDHRSVLCEIFADWLPTDDGHVVLDGAVKDVWHRPVARVRIGKHPHDLEVSRFLAGKAVALMKELGADDVEVDISTAPPSNLVAGGCRFGTDPRHAVLDADCRVYGADNLFVADASFMPSGGSVPYTWTIYANALRVADQMLRQI